MKDFSIDIKNFVKLETFNILADDILYMKKDIDKFVVKNELLSRLNVLNQDVNIKFKDRPTRS